mmetsp:Transcript_62/g.230  ORF Transcript_62/g.230 Transcript_62/m.230 type:complete len:248 (+) Transcript_62:572-1315(+)
MIISLALTVALNLNPSALVRKSMLSPTGGHDVGPFSSLCALMNRLNSFTMRLVSTIFSCTIFRTMILRNMTLTDGKLSITRSSVSFLSVKQSQKVSDTALYPRCIVRQSMSSPKHALSPMVRTRPLHITTPLFSTKSLVLSSLSPMMCSSGGKVSSTKLKLSSMATCSGIPWKISTLISHAVLICVATSCRMLGDMRSRSSPHEIWFVTLRLYLKNARSLPARSTSILASLINRLSRSISSWNSVSR